jgi:hypothetical protein
MVECLSNKQNALSLIPSTEKEKKIDGYSAYLMEVYIRL